MQRIVGLVIALLILSVFFGVIERLWPSSRTQRRSRQSLITDLAWWGFTPLIGKVFAGVVVGVFILVVAFPKATANGAFVGLLAGMASVAWAASYTSVAFLWHNVIGAVAVVLVGMAVSLLRPGSNMRRGPLRSADL